MIDKCDLEYIGMLGSKPYHHILRCNTHPHNFFSESDKVEVCDKAPKPTKQVALTITVPTGDYCWLFDNSAPPCQFLRQEGGNADCGIVYFNLAGSITEDERGYKKPLACRQLLEATK